MESERSSSTTRRRAAVFESSSESDSELEPARSASATRDSQKTRPKKKRACQFLQSWLPTYEAESPTQVGQGMSGDFCHLKCMRLYISMAGCALAVTCEVRAHLADREIVCVGDRDRMTDGGFCGYSGIEIVRGACRLWSDRFSIARSSREIAIAQAGLARSNSQSKIYKGLGQRERRAKLEEKRFSARPKAETGGHAAVFWFCSALYFRL